MSEQSSSGRLSKQLVAAISMIFVIGIGLALWLTFIKLRLEFDPDYQSSCNVGDKLNCDRVQTSAYSIIFGYPLALWGAGVYLVGIFAAWMAHKSETSGRAWLGALVVGGVAACAHSLYLAYVSSFLIGAYCIYCISMYAVNFVCTGLVIGAFRKSGPISEATDFLGQPRVLGGIGVLTAVVFAVALPVYGAVRTSMKEARLAHDLAQMKAVTAVKKSANAETKTGQSDVGAGSAAASAGAAVAAGASSSAATGASSRGAASGSAAGAASVAGGDSSAGEQGIITHPTFGFRYSNVILRKGRAFFEVPLSKHDWPLGPEDAPVKITMFGDFECGYCRALFRNMKPLKDKHKGKIRWVFKHWPLNNNCNKVMKGVQHPQACLAAKASNCAGEQGKFWPMHDEIYSQDLRLNPVNLREWAVKVGVDGTKYDNCMSRTEPHPKLTEDIRAGRFARIAGTPRTYVNGHLVPGVVATEILEHFIKSGIDAAKSKPQRNVNARAQHGMVEMKANSGAFWIDAYEASIDANGHARSISGVRPAEASWYDANAACKKAGKRLCSEEEWVSACTGAPAIDNDGNGDFTDDEVEGLLYSYGNFPEGGRCNANQPSGGSAVATGSMPRCRSEAGLFDMSANLAEWTGVDEKAGLLSGTDFRWGAKATCLKRQKRFGLGYRNNTTGFRCCADQPVPPPTAAKIVQHIRHGATGQPVPKFAATLQDGTKISDRDISKGVWIVSFFASWCGPCRRELPDLNAFYTQHKAKGLEVLAVGVDMTENAMRTFIEGLKLQYKVAYDPKAVSMGAFGVRGMPTAFVVAHGKVIHRLVGINKTKTDLFKKAALDALARK